MANKHPPNNINGSFLRKTGKLCNFLKALKNLIALFVQSSHTKWIKQTNTLGVQMTKTNVHSSSNISKISKIPHEIARKH